MTARQEFAQLIAALNGSARTETLMGREYLVTPAVLVQGQVLNNNLGATFLPPDDITDEWAEEWNGAPVVVHEHPSSRGMAISARTPEVLDAIGAGFVFRAKAVRNGVAQLKGEVWLDVARAAQIKELDEILQRLRDGQKVELSTGFSVMLEERQGVFNGEAYDLVMHPQGSDHLAIFVDKIGACSVEDGCGLGANARAKARRPTYRGTTEDAWSAPSLADFEGADATWDGLSAARKRAIVATTLLGDVQDTFGASMLFPVVDAQGRLNRNALNAVRSGAAGGARKPKGVPQAALDSAFAMAGTLLQKEFDVKANDVAEGERGKILGLVDKLVGMLGGERKVEDDTPPEEKYAAELRTHLRALKAFGMTNREIGEALGQSELSVCQTQRACAGAGLPATAEMVASAAALVEKRLAGNADGSDEEKRMALSRALEGSYGGPGRYVWIEAVYSQESQVVFGVVMDTLGGRKEQLYSATYALADDGKVTFSEPQAVVRRTVYDPVSTNQEVPVEKDKGTVPAANAAPVKEPVKEEPVKAEPVKAEPVAGNAGADLKAAQEKIASLEGTIAEQAKAIATLQSTVAPAIEERERERKALVAELAANESVPFDEAELEAKPLDELKKLRAMSRGEHYAGRGGPRVATQTSEPQYAEPVPYFAAQAQKKEGE